MGDRRRGVGSVKRKRGRKEKPAKNG